MEVEDDKDMNSLDEAQKQQHEVQQPQKQSRRRRLHTARPYQERLFNMAEARREIVAALKLHRASMKQSNETETQSMAAATSTLQRRSNELVADSIRNSINHPPNRTLDKYFHASPFLLTSTYPSLAPVSIFDQLNFHLPDQPLGLNLNLNLNLNLQNFQNLDTSIYHSIHNPKPAEPSSSSCSNSSPNAIMAGTQRPANSQQWVSLHQAIIDDEEMAEIQSIGEQHDMEWNDKMNLATSAWWSKFLKSMEEGGKGEGHREANGDCIYAFGETWLNGVGEDANESSLFQQHLDDDFHVDDYL